MDQGSISTTQTEWKIAPAGHGRSAIVLAAALLLLLLAPARAGIAEGVAAYDQGDLRTAFREFRAAAENDDPTAQAVLAHMFANGEGVARNIAAAAKWYRKAAEQGVVSAQNALGHLYAGEPGIGRDYVRAHMWFAVAVRNYPPGTSRDNALRDRERVAKMLSPAELEKARRMANAWSTTYPRKERR